jgi:asparagine synthetase B (glutamine-hydrolysing)
MVRELVRIKLRGRDFFVMPAGSRPHFNPSEDVEKRLIEFASDQLPNYWLRTDSQSSMSMPLERRAPLLDYRVVELGFQLPLEYLMREGWMKWILREAMDKDVQPEVAWRRANVSSTS